jgi:hypothetical protein
MSGQVGWRPDPSALWIDEERHVRESLREHRNMPPGDPVPASELEPFATEREKAIAVFQAPTISVAASIARRGSIATRYNFRSAWPHLLRFERFVQPCLRPRRSPLSPTTS